MGKNTSGNCEIAALPPLPLPAKGVEFMEGVTFQLTSEKTPYGEVASYISASRELLFFNSFSEHKPVLCLCSKRSPFLLVLLCLGLK